MGAQAQDLAQDIHQEVFLRLWRDDARLMRQLRELRSINAWLVVLAQRQTVDYLRHAGTRQKYDDLAVREQSSAYPSPEAAAQHMEIRDLVAQVLTEIAEEDRLLLTLYYVDGLRYTDIAEMLGFNINTVAARLHRAKLKLRKLLEGHEL